MKLPSLISHFRRKKEFRAAASKARHDWAIMFVVFLIINMALAVWNTWFLFRIANGTLFGNGSGSTAPSQADILSEKDVLSLASFVNERVKSFDNGNVSNISAPADPWH